MRHTKEGDLQELERLCLRYPEKAMELLALRGRKRFLALYKEVSGVDATKGIVIECGEELQVTYMRSVYGYE